ncbi:30S ribosomal protein S20 [Marinicella pacifica]|uniref:Small ribosomal subunit protein bS20 n=1 Tax=Marinicella pacifica TaxID=1171543 RepID=A0A917FN29_9GAMM|nr:30S ribosomal protein S20 [Marinicella pacifica]GGF90566.1 30S ribosomal protein S20 [Marinicella pacifica]
MANSASARKRIRQAAKNRQLNMSQRSKARTKIKNVLSAIEAGDKEKAQKLYNEMVPVVDSVARKGLYHKNKIARHKSRLNAKIKAMA